MTCAVAMLLVACSADEGEPDGPPGAADDEGTATVEPTGDATELPDPVPTTLPGPDEGSGRDDGEETAGPGAPGGDAATETPGTERTVLTRLEFEIPADWEVEDMGEAQAADPQPGEIPPHQWCLVPPGDLAPVDGCGGVVVAIGGDWLPGASGSRYQPNQAGAWWAGQDEPACPFGEEAGGQRDEDAEGAEGEEGGAGEAAGEAASGEDGAGGAVDPAVTANDGLPLTSQTTTVGPHVARYETWRVSCEQSGQTLTPQLWHLPELNVLVKDYYGHPDTVAVLHGLQRP
ncbi:hypothetical protein [Ornithinicoccus halotolerans]|uniref:hypothetical protein n=1 Tax=Ornithinicoccus halotolerans TaxID=1748220 RepID=UPI001295A949|nr:hypothetical protein [Ornithinicoccus halotolerans]